MSGSGKSLLGLWLYRTGEEWTLKEGEHEVCIIFQKLTSVSPQNNIERQLQTSVEIYLQRENASRSRSRFEKLGNFFIEKPSRRSREGVTSFPGTLYLHTLLDFFIIIIVRGAFTF
jgi:hypothetical protein